MSYTLPVISTTQNANGIVTLACKGLLPALQVKTNPFSSTVTFSSKDSSTTSNYSENWGTTNITFLRSSYYYMDSEIVHIIVEAPNNIFTLFYVNWTISNLGQVAKPDYTNYPVIFYQDSSLANGLIMKGFRYTNSTLKAVVNPTNKTSTIPNQLDNGASYSGKGTFIINNANKIQINSGYSILGSSGEFDSNGVLHN